MQEFYKKNWIPIFHHHQQQHHALQEISFLFSPPLLFIQKTERNNKEKAERERCALYMGIPTHMDIMHIHTSHLWKTRRSFYPLMQTYIHKHRHRCIYDVCTYNMSTIYTFHTYYIPLFTLHHTFTEKNFTILLFISSLFLLLLYPVSVSVCLRMAEKELVVVVWWQKSGVNRDAFGKRWRREDATKTKKDAMIILLLGCCC